MKEPWNEPFGLSTDIISASPATYAASSAAAALCCRPVRALLLALARAAPPYPCASSLCRLLLSDSSGSFGASVTPELALVVVIPELAPGRSTASLSLVDSSASVYGARYVCTPLRGKPDAAALGCPSGAFSLSSKPCSSRLLKYCSLFRDRISGEIGESWRSGDTSWTSRS